LPIVLARGNLILFAWSIVTLQFLTSVVFIYAACRSPRPPRNAHISS
jgi:hypothetical protein